MSTATSQPAAAERPCEYGFGACDRLDARPYPCGDRCPDHTPARLAGHPEPDTARYCLTRCYCGHHDGYDRPMEPLTDNIVDFRAVASGKRREKDPARYRAAQAAVQQTRQEQPA